MRNLSWPQADYLTTKDSRLVRREAWTRWVMYDPAVFLYFSQIPSLKTDEDPEAWFHVVLNSEFTAAEWLANDWTDEPWDDSFAIPPVIGIPVLPPPWGDGGAGTGDGGSGGGLGGGTPGTGPLGPPPGDGGGIYTSGPAHGPVGNRRPHPETPSEIEPAVVTLEAHWETDPDGGTPLFYSVGPDGIISTSDDYFVAEGTYLGGDPYYVYVNGYTNVCWHGVPSTNRIIGTVTVTGGRPGASQPVTIRDVTGGILVFNMSVPGSFNFETDPQTYLGKTIFARVGMPPAPPDVFTVDTDSNNVVMTVYPDCSTLE